MKVFLQFNCDTCGYEFTEELDLNSHIGMYHGRISANRSEAQIEQLKEIPSSTNVAVATEVICPLCNLKSKNSDTLKSHIVNVHTNVKSKENPEEQIQIESTETCTKCSLCNFIGEQNELKEHTEKKHGPKITFGDSRDLDIHIEGVHSNSINEPFQCAQCRCVVKDKKELEDHMIESHEDKVLLHTIATEVNQMHKNQELHNSLLRDVFTVLESIFENQNIIKQELLINRNQTTNTTKKSDTKEKDIEKIETKKNDTKSDNVKKNEDVEEKKLTEDDIPRKNSHKHNITWIGTSLSKVLDKKKVEKDLDVDLKAVKAYCIKKEGRFPEENFEEVVPDIIKDAQIDTLVLEAGNIEISNLEVNNALMDAGNDIEEVKKEWFETVEDASKSLFKIAENSVATNPKMNVVILKRTPRFDKSSKDIGIKAKLSEFANRVYDQCLIKSSNSKRIHIADIKLGVENNKFLKELIYGQPENPRYDGIHLEGSGASRHFTYKAVQALKHIVPNKSLLRSQPTDHTRCPQAQYQRYHTRCPQAQYQREQLIKQRGKEVIQSEQYVSYASAVKNSGHTQNSSLGAQRNCFSIPTRNRFEQLSRNSQENW